MFKIFKRLKSTHIKLLTALFVLAFVTGVNSEPTVENIVEDPNLLGTDISGADPNVITILDLSGSMGRNFGGSQRGNYDNRTVFDYCGDITPDNTDERIDIGFCAENIANLTVCASVNCTEDGHRCREAVDLTNQEQCIFDGAGIADRFGILANGQSPACIYDRVCGNNDGTCNEDRTSCGNGDERNRAAWALEAAAGFTQCSSAANCQLAGDLDPSCNTANDITRFFDCMDDLQTINDELYSDETLLTVPQPVNCDGGTVNPAFPPPPEFLNCDGVPEFGSSRMDGALNVFLNVLDSNDSLESEMCDDLGNLWDGINGTSPITCKEFLETPYRQVSDFIYDGGTITPYPSTDDEALSLPNPSGQDIRDLLTDEDADNFNINFLPMYYSGENNGDACDPDGTQTEIDDQSAYGMATGGFQGGDAAAINRVWDFYRQEKAGGGTPLALILGFDDDVNPTAGDGSNFVRNDTLLAFANSLPDDAAIDCRPQFVIVITDGDDSCSGDCADDANSCTGVAAASSNANRRSSINAVSKLRTYFARNPVTSNIPGFGTVPKEVLTFVVGLGIDDPNAIRALNAMALAGGTHTNGVIRHVDPATGADFGTVEIDPTATNSVLPGTVGDELEIYRNIARAEGIATASPVDALLGTCDTPDVNGTCTFGVDDVFNNLYLDSGLHTDGVTPVDLSGFAFLANSPEELADAIETIISSIDDFTTSGSAPAAPQSSINVSARDRMFLSILTPIETERLWQGRLALYGFIDSQDPDSPGSRTIVRRPANVSEATDPTTIRTISIFDSNGSLDADAKGFYWEAGKLLAERDISAAGSPRNLLTVKPVATDTGFVNIGDTLDITDPTLTPSDFGVGTDDVFAPIPDFCADATQIADCNAFTTPDCDDGPLFIDNPNCQSCVIQCIKDKTVDFLIGNTEIRPFEEDDPTNPGSTRGDPLGKPSTGAKVDAGQPSLTAPDPTMGFGCPPFDGTPGGSLATCSLRLGDIFHSNPVLVGSPSPLFFDLGFQQFAAGFLKRSAAVYAGANDGFLHSFHAGEFVNAGPGAPETNPFTLQPEEIPFFNEGSGLEVFGFAPPSFLRDSRSDNDPFIFEEGTAQEGPSPDYRVGDFKSFVIEENMQRAFFDGAPTVGDVWIDAYKNGIPEDSSLCADGGGVTINTPDGNLDLCGREWHTTLISGFRNGGGGFTALDITNFGCGNADGVSSPGDTACSTPGKYLTGGGSPDYPKHLWTKFDTDFGNSWSQPVFGRVQLAIDDGINDPTIVDRWVMFAGGGKDPEDTDPREGGVEFGKGFYVIDIATGQTIFKFHPDDPIDNDDNTIANTNDMVCEMAARVGAFDINADGFIDLVYGGDTCGRMWRFDVSLPLETGSGISQTGLHGTAVLKSPGWSGEIAFCTGDCDDGAGNVQLPPFTDDGNPNNDSDLPSIYFAPTLVFDDAGQRHVIFVTGNRSDPTTIADFDDMGTQDPSDDTPIPGTFEFGSLFNFIDNYVPAFLAGGTAITTTLKTEQDLINDDQIIEIETFVGGSIPAELKAFQVNPDPDFNAARGEFVVRFPDNLVLTDPRGEKGFGTPTIINRVLVFTTFAPDAANNNPCVAAFGEGRLFAIDFLTGEAALGRIPGARQSVLKGVSDPDDVDQVAGLKVADGVPSAAQITYGVRGSAILTVAFSGSPATGGAQFLVWELPPFPSRTQTLFWEEII